MRGTYTYNTYNVRISGYQLLLNERTGILVINTQYLVVLAKVCAF